VISKLVEQAGHPISKDDEKSDGDRERFPIDKWINLMFHIIGTKSISITVEHS